MATIKVKVLTETRVKTKRSGLQCYSCSAISSESSICIITIWNEEQLKHLVVGQYVIIRDCQLHQKDEVVFVQLRETSKVCYFIFTVIIFLQTDIQFL